MIFHDRIISFSSSFSSVFHFFHPSFSLFCPPFLSSSIPIFLLFHAVFLFYISPLFFSSFFCFFPFSVYFPSSTFFLPPISLPFTFPSALSPFFLFFQSFLFSSGFSPLFISFLPHCETMQVYLTKEAILNLIIYFRPMQDKEMLSQCDMCDW